MIYILFKISKNYSLKKKQSNSVAEWSAMPGLVVLPSLGREFEPRVRLLFFFFLSLFSQFLIFSSLELKAHRVS